MMVQEEQAFDFEGRSIYVQRLPVGKNHVFKIRFESGVQPLIVTMAVGAGGDKFWTSVPEGRQEEAEAIGVILNKHFNSK